MPGHWKSTDFSNFFIDHVTAWRSLALSLHRNRRQVILHIEKKIEPALDGIIFFNYFCIH
jgi:hypothetical protein